MAEIRGMRLDRMRSLLLTPCSLFAVISLVACGQTPSTTGATGTGAGGAGTSGATTSAGGGGSGPWRSALYP